MYLMVKFVVDLTRLNFKQVSLQTVYYYYYYYYYYECKSCQALFRLCVPLDTIFFFAQQTWSKIIMRWFEPPSDDKRQAIMEQLSAGISIRNTYDSLPFDVLHNFPIVVSFGLLKISFFILDFPLQSNISSGARFGFCYRVQYR